MLTLGHAGITFGVALTAHSLSTRSRNTERSDQTPGMRIRGQVHSLSQRIDLRVLFLGALLPDIIDKPLGLLVLPDVYGTGRLFGHSLLFVLAIGLAGAWLYRARKRNWLLVLTYGAAMHLLLDSMWRAPSVLFWPFVGSLPQGGTPEVWLSRMLATPAQNPSALISEAVGFVLLMPLIWSILRGSGLRQFLRYGEVE